ncbi:MAG TPA: hypothetical protein ENN13_02165 [Candidatus Altiarchaeales archaeon]|nr:hypothetical protein [Candidatus Altiarchaeales archaeon]
MDVRFIKKEKDVVEIEFSEKEVPQALISILNEMGVDAYTYEPHPLMPGFRLHIESDDALADFQKALKRLGGDWSDFSKLIESKL